MDLEKPNSAEKFIGGMAERLGAAAQAATVFGHRDEFDRKFDQRQLLSGVHKPNDTGG